MESIQDSVQCFLYKMKEVGYSKASIDVASAALNNLIQSHLNKNEVSLNYDIAETHIRSIDGIMAQDELGKWKMSKNIWFIKKYLVFIESGEINADHFTDPLFPLENELASVIQRYVEETAVNNKQKKSRIWAPKRYAKWLSNHGIHSFSDIKVSDLRLFIIEDTHNLKSKTIPNFRSELRRFHIWLYKKGFIPDTYENLFDFRIAIENKIHPAVLPDDVAKILEQIDRKTAIGKRDYAMMPCGIVLGLRGCDLIRLKRTDVDWYKGELRICQHKTSKPLALPLTTDIAEAMKDYILHGRPECDEANVFLRHNTPIGILKSGSISGQIFNYYKKKAGLEFVGSYYAVRRAVGKNLVVAGTPVTDVAQVLGHTDIANTKQYISLDTEHLKICSLGFEGIRPRRWSS